MPSKRLWYDEREGDARDFLAANPGATTDDLQRHLRVGWNRARLLMLVVNSNGREGDDGDA